MSVADHDLDDDDPSGFCMKCGMFFEDYGLLCESCKKDNIDLYADAKYQDKVEGK